MFEYHAVVIFNWRISHEKPIYCSSGIILVGEWSRQREELTISRMLLGITIPVLFFAGMGLTALIIFLKNLKSPDSRGIPWRRLSMWAFWGLGAFIAVFALGNRIPAFLAAYNTAMAAVQPSNHFITGCSTEESTLRGDS